MTQRWSFYGRSAELALVERILARGAWFMCSLQGRRRIGKSELLRHVLAMRPDLRSVWCQLPDGTEGHAVSAFKNALAVSEDTSVTRRAGTVTDFASLAKTVGDLCREGYVVVLDEFQFLCRPALYPLASFLQEQIDRLRGTNRGGLFVLGSLQTEMETVLADRNAPLFGRRTDGIKLKHWQFADLIQMFRAQGIRSPSQWLTLWSLFEGVPKYYKDAHDYGVLQLAAEGFSDELLARMFLDRGSALRVEADTWLLKELKGTALGVLDFVARNPGKYAGDITAALAPATPESTRVYLGHLVDRFEVIAKLLPVFAGESSRSARYYVSDNFTQAWLAFGKLLVSSGEQASRARALALAQPRLPVHEGACFEKLVRQLHVECSQRDLDFPLKEVLTGYWNKAKLAERSIEIDLVAIDVGSKSVRIGSCKRSASAHDIHSLAGFEKHIHLFHQTPEGRRLRDFSTERMLFAPEFSKEERTKLESSGTYKCRDLADYAGLL